MKGIRWLPYKCEECGCYYMHLRAKEGYGSGDSFLWLDNDGARVRANQRAAMDLDRKLNGQDDPVCCPDCGMYSESMVSRLKRKRWFLFGAVCLIPIFFGVSLVSALESTRKMLMIAIIGLGIIIFGINTFNYDPNKTAHKRRARSFSDGYPVLRLREWEDLQRQIGK